MILLSVQDIVKHYGPEPVLDGVTFDVRPGERASLVGPNGAGKTTLLRIIAGTRASRTAGAVERHSSATPRLSGAAPGVRAGPHGVGRGPHRPWPSSPTWPARSEELAHAIAVETDEAERKRLEQRFDHAAARTCTTTTPTTSTTRSSGCWTGSAFAETSFTASGRASSAAASRTGCCWPSCCWPSPT